MHLHSDVFFPTTGGLTTIKCTKSKLADRLADSLADSLYDQMCSMIPEALKEHPFCLLSTVINTTSTRHPRPT